MQVPVQCDDDGDGERRPDAFRQAERLKIEAAR